MKRISFLLIVLCLYGFSNAQKTITLTYDSKDFKFDNVEGFVKITTNLPNLRRAGDTLSPHLPFFPCRVLLPQDDNEVTFQVRYKKELLFENVKIATNPKPTIRTKVVKQVANQTSAIRSVESPVFDNGVVQVNGIKYLYLKVTPFLYNAENGELDFVPKIEIVFPTLPGETNYNYVNKIGGNDQIPTKIKEKYVNPEDLYFFCKNNVELEINKSASSNMNICSLQNLPLSQFANNIDYLIITSDSLANSFQGLKARKRIKGLRAEIITTSAIYSAYTSGTNQEKIKQFINDIGMYSMANYGPYLAPNKFVLLGGDNTVVPVYYSSFYLNGNREEDTPTDLFYACPNWDEQGGNTIDHYGLNPFVFLTRLPIRTSQQVLDYTAKTIAYEDDMWTNNKILFAANCIDDMHNGVSDAHFLSDMIASAIPSYSQLLKLYDTGSDFPFYISGSNLFNVIEDGYGVIHEISHGTYDYWDTGSDNYTSNQAISQYNDYLSTVISGACYTNAFDMQDIDPCLSEAFLRNANGGAIAYFGSSRLGFGGNDTHNTYTELMFSDLFNYYFLTHLYINESVSDPEPFSFGSIAASAKQDLIEESNSTSSSDYDALGYRSLQHAINPSGDPELQIFTDYSNRMNTQELPIITILPGIGISIEAQEPDCLVRILPDDNSEPLRIVLTYQGETKMFYTTSNCNIAIIKKNYCPEFIRAIVNPSTSNTPLALNVTTKGNNLFEVFVSAKEINQRVFNPEYRNWTLDVIDPLTGIRRLSKEVSDGKLFLNTSSWKKGLYILKANLKGRELTCKLTIK